MAETNDDHPETQQQSIDDAAKETAQSEESSPLGRFLLYGMSLPERAVRSTIGLAAGTAREAAGFLVPQAFQDGKTYEIVVRNSLGFLTEEIGGVENTSETGEGTADDYMARKAVGNFVDLAGLATLHVSPLWFMAIVSDVAYGSKTYVLELADELKRQGLIDDTSTIHHVDDVLAAVQNATGEVATMFDTPPLSVDQLKESLENTKQAIASTDYRNVLPEAELNRYWTEVREIAEDENVNLIGMSGALTMHTLGKLGTVTRGTMTSVQVAGGLFNRHVVGHYVKSLESMRERGFYQTVKDSSEPYVEAVWKNFSVDRETWTEDLLSGKAFGKAYNTVAGWFAGPQKKAADDADPKTSSGRTAPPVIDGDSSQ